MKSEFNWSREIHDYTEEQQITPGGRVGEMRGVSTVITPYRKYHPANTWVSLRLASP